MKLLEYIYSLRNDRTMTAYKIYNSWHNILKGEVVFENNIDNITARKFSKSEKLKETILHLDENNISLNNIYVIFSQYTIDRFENDMPITLQNLEQLSKFCNFMTIIPDIDEIDIFILYTLNNDAPMYLVDIIHTKYDFPTTYNNDYTMNISISGLSYERAKMLEIILRRISTNKNWTDLVVKKNIFSLGDIDIQISSNILDNCSIDTDTLLDDNMSKLFTNKYTEQIMDIDKTASKFTVDRYSYHKYYLPSILMKKFKELEQNNQL